MLTLNDDHDRGAVPAERAEAEATLRRAMLSRYASLSVLVTAALSGVAAREGWIAYRAAAATSSTPAGVLMVFALGAVTLALGLTLRRIARS
ncbi:MAG TPA: hypothetical protein VF310_17625 [Vicinamibacteria bacterium]